ncbi:MAG: hypothetical protein V4502_08185 [Pseudomonadota bacterium]
MNRRGFLAALVAAPAALAFDPERALWVPGRKLISVSPARVSTGYAYKWGGHILYRIEFRDGPLEPIAQQQPDGVIIGRRARPYRRGERRDAALRADAAARRGSLFSRGRV